MKRIIVIAGPTASGKTALSVALAKYFGCAIISADSRQFYKELSIGTAKPSLVEMEDVKHYFIGTHSVKTPLSVGQYELEALQKIKSIFEKEKLVVVVGGSGMFIDALVYGTDNLPHKETIRNKWTELWELNGIKFLQDELKKNDGDYYKKVDENNPMRLIRALEVIEITGKSYSSLLSKQQKTPRYSTTFFVINHPREELYERINFRVDLMLQNGLLNEVKSNIENRELQSLNTVGYKELFAYLDGEITLERAVALIKKNTRNYAKRQLTWFRKNKDVHWLTPQDNKRMVKEIIRILDEEKK